jgi:hypothetical protein
MASRDVLDPRYHKPEGLQFSRTTQISPRNLRQEPI